MDLLKKIVLLIVLEILIFLISLLWLTPTVAIRLTLSLPFLLFLPGYFLMKSFIKLNLDAIEQITTSVILSMTVIFLGIYIVEESVTKLTPINLTFTILFINLSCFILYKLSGADIFESGQFTRIYHKLRKKS